MNENENEVEEILVFPMCGLCNDLRMQPFYVPELKKEQNDVFKTDRKFQPYSVGKKDNYTFTCVSCFDPEENQTAYFFEAKN